MCIINEFRCHEVKIEESEKASPLCLHQCFTPTHISLTQVAKRLGCHGNIISLRRMQNQLTNHSSMRFVVCWVVRRVVWL